MTLYVFILFHWFLQSEKINYRKNLQGEIKMFYVLFSCRNWPLEKRSLSFYCYSLFAAAFRSPQFQTLVNNVGFINTFINQFSLKIRAKSIYIESGCGLATETFLIFFKYAIKTKREIGINKIDFKVFAVVQSIRYIRKVH